ncbi:hemerythrin domain-containing protein [Actinomycetes bacterium KLBMP 9797]
MIDVLAAEHATLAALCARLADPATARPREVADVLAATASRHLCAEEQYLYPAVRAALPDGATLVEREIAADRALRRALRRPAADPATLTSELRRHAEAVTALAAALAAVTPPGDLVRLGNRVEVAEEAAPTRPHPDAPARPPWNKITDPALGVCDRVRDVLTGRRTHPDDLTREYRYPLY